MQKQMEQLKDQIIAGIPDGLSMMEQIRYLYIELGKMVSFDERYWKGNSKMQKKIYRGSFRKKIEDLRTDRRIICVSLSVMFQELLTEIGVYASLNQPDPEDPHINNLVLCDGKRYVMDLQRDLEYIQTNRRTRFSEKRKWHLIPLLLYPRKKKKPWTVKLAITEKKMVAMIMHKTTCKI